MTLFGIDFQHLLIIYGPFFAFAVIFSESFFLFFLPGDSFIFLAGLLATQHYFGFWPMMIYMIIGAFIGNVIGYSLGKTVGLRLFQRQSRLFNQEGLEKTRAFYHRYGPLALVIGRFTPFVRTFIPILAGSATMDYPVFLSYSTAGALLWVFGVGALGYTLGTTVPNIDRYILPIIGLIILVSVTPPAIAYWRHRAKKR